MGPPTHLPGFEGLAEVSAWRLESSAKTGRNWSALGRVADTGFLLHKQAMARIQKAEGRTVPSRLIELARVGKDTAGHDDEL